MNKLKKYNQIVFAIVGSITLILLLFAGGKFLIDEFFDTPVYSDPSLIVKDELDSLKALNLRNQIVSLEKVKVFDTVSNTYLIPVYHKELQDPSSRNSNIMGLLDLQYSAEYMYYGYGNYNNLLLHNFTTRETQILSSTRINIDQYKVFSTSKNNKLIVFTGWDKDTNADRKLGNQDFKQAYVYNHSAGSTKRIDNNLFNILDYEYLKRVDKLIFRVTEVKSELLKEEKPEFFVYYLPQDGTLQPLVDLTIINRLQDIIDN